MFDDDDDEEENRSNSSQRFYVHNRPLITLNEIYSDKVIAHVKRWYERHSLPQLNLLIKRGLLKTFKDKSIRMSLGTVSLFQMINFELLILVEKERNLRSIRSKWKNSFVVR